jgi:hypothetical protein
MSANASDGGEPGPRSAPGTTASQIPKTTALSSPVHSSGANTRRAGGEARRQRANRIARVATATTPAVIRAGTLNTFTSAGESPTRKGLGPHAGQWLEAGWNSNVNGWRPSAAT